MLFLHDSKSLYEPVIFQNENELETFCTERAEQVFWPWYASGVPLYANRKLVLASAAGLKSVPDGFLLWLDDDPECTSLSMVEYEMEGHSVDEHIIPQLIRFQKVLDNRATQRMIESLFCDRLAITLKQPRFTKRYHSIDASGLLSRLTAKAEDVGIVVVVNQVSPDIGNAVPRLKKHAPCTYLLQVQALVPARHVAVRLLRPGTKVYARYPKPSDPNYQEWYAATVKSASTPRCKVEWEDGDRGNRSVDYAVPRNEAVVAVEEMELE
jgi:hypothetical protein